MKPIQKIKILIDVSMTVLLLILMAYHLTGNRLHEWLGVLLCFLFILHHWLNRRWIARLCRGRWPAIRILTTAVNLLLFAAMAGMIISGILLSRDVFGFLGLRAGMFGRRLHMLSTSWGYLLLSMHIGLHWGMMAGVLRRKLPLSNSAVRLVWQLLPLLLAAYGVYALITRQLADRLFLLMEYAFFDYREPALFFFADYLCILILFAVLAFYLAKLCQKKRKIQ